MEKHKKLAVTEEEKSINIVDLFVYLVVHWKWYLLSILRLEDVSGIFTVRHHLRTAGSHRDD